VRVDPENIAITLREILEELATASWLKKLNEPFLRNAYTLAAQQTFESLAQKFSNSSDTNYKGNIGQYIVSCLAKRAIVQEYGHLDIPLMEYIGLRKCGNSGFDFYTENQSTQTMYCGESKYVDGENAYGRSLNQIADFVKSKKYQLDAILLAPFANSSSLNNLSSGSFGISVAFSSTNIADERLMENIQRNTNFQELLKFDDILCVAVNI